MAGLTDKKTIDCIHFLDTKASHLQDSDRHQPSSIPISSLIVAHSHIGILIINEAFYCIYANAAMADILACPLETIAGSDCREYFPEKSRKAIIGLCSQKQPEEVLPERYEIEFIRKSNEVGTAEIHVDAVKTPDRKIATIIQAFDITARKRMREEIEKSEKKYHDFFQNVLDFIFIHDLEGNFIENNARYVMEVGARPDVIAASNLRDLIPEIFKPGFDDYLKRIRKNGRDEGVIAIQVPGGEIRILEYKNLLLYDENNRPASVMGSARDITQHIKDKKALRENRGRYQMILENVGDYIFEIDLAGNYTFVNDALIKKSGYSKEALIGMNYRDYTFPEERGVIEAYHYEIFTNGETGKSLQHRVIRKDGSFLFIELVVSLIKNDNGSPVGFRGVARDITERKVAEKNLQKLHEALEEKVEERTRELQEVNIALEVLLKKRENDKKKFEDKVAYSIKEVLTPHLELLKNTRLDKHQKVYLEILEENFKAIASPFMDVLSGNLQKLTRTEIQVINLIKQHKLTKEIADLMGVSTRTVDTHRDNIRKKLGIKNKKVNIRSFLMNPE